MNWTEEDLLREQVTQERIKLTVQEEFQLIFKRIEFSLLERIWPVHQKIGDAISGKITEYPNEAIHDDCVVAFTGIYEKIVSEVQTQRVNVDKRYST